MRAIDTMLKTGNSSFVAAHSAEVATHLAAGVSLLKSERQGAQSMTPFFAPKFYGGRHGGALGRADPLIRKANPVASATLSISLDGGGSLSQRIPS
jgi:hypothetical protein